MQGIKSQQNDLLQALQEQVRYFDIHDKRIVRPDHERSHEDGELELLIDPTPTRGRVGDFLSINYEQASELVKGMEAVVSGL